MNIDISELYVYKIHFTVYFELKRSYWSLVIPIYFRLPVYLNLFIENIVYLNVTFSTVFILKRQLVKEVRSEKHYHSVISAS